jgi:undecaprenyl-diphosphatase
MPSFPRSIVIFCAEYLVLIQGILFLLLLNQRENISEALAIFCTGTMLLLLSLFITKLLKIIIRKKRPAKRIEFFEPFDTYAFPSGHATALASLVLFVSVYSTAIGSIMCLVGLAVVIARVQSHVHYVSDIIGGITVGLLVTYYALTPISNMVHMLFYA